MASSVILICQVLVYSSSILVKLSSLELEYLGPFSVFLSPSVLLIE